jgi:hypothetical protein
MLRTGGTPRSVNIYTPDGVLSCPLSGDTRNGVRGFRRGLDLFCRAMKKCEHVIDAWQEALAHSSDEDTVHRHRRQIRALEAQFQLLAARALPPRRACRTIYRQPRLRQPRRQRARRTVVNTSQSARGDSGDSDGDPAPEPPSDRRTLSTESAPTRRAGPISSSSAERARWPMAPAGASVDARPPPGSLRHRRRRSDRRLIAGTSPRPNTRGGFELFASGAARLAGSADTFGPKIGTRAFVGHEIRVTLEKRPRRDRPTCCSVLDADVAARQLRPITVASVFVARPRRAPRLGILRRDSLALAPVRPGRNSTVSPGPGQLGRMGHQGLPPAAGAAPRELRLKLRPPLTRLRTRDPAPAWMEAKTKSITRDHGAPARSGGRP